MKTLKTLSIAIAFIVIATVTFANTYNVTNFEVKASTDLPVIIKHMVKQDFTRLNNYFHLNNIDKLKADVTFEFFINNDNKINIVSIESKDQQATEYVKQLLNQTKLNVNDNVANKVYKLVIKLDYRT